ncbi:MAG: ABC transporter substrate-binding protein [Caulobacteraceae bacterium]
MFRRRTALALIAFAVTGLIAGCAPKPQAQAGGQGGPQRTVIRFATDWKAQAEHGGFYQALATGEYARRGLDVRIIQGGPGVNVPQLVASGAVELGMGSNSFIVMNLANEGVPVRAVAAFMQKDPQVLIAHAGQGINSIADMKGHPILLSDASVTAFWVWMKAKYGFTDSQIRPYTFNSAPFLADQRIVQQGYLTSEPYTIERESGVKPLVFLLADEGYPGYATMILASDTLIASNPAAIRAFNEATAAGWRSYLYGDPAPGNRLIMRDNPEMTQDLLDQARNKLRDEGIIDSGDARTLGIGAMTDARWAEFFRVASSQGVYPATLDPKKAYTLEFLPRPPAAR